MKCTTIESFIKNKIFYTERVEDKFWYEGAANFVVACVKQELMNKTIYEICEYFLIDGDKKNIDSYAKFEHFSSYNIDDINHILLTTAQNTKIGYLSCIPEAIEKYLKNRDLETENACNNHHED